MLISPDEVKAKAKSKENENYAFRTYLKMHADPLKLDEQFRKLHEELFSGYDCSQCRNCCKMYCGMIPQEDIEKAAGQFSMSGKDFVERFLEYDPGEMSYKTKHCPCDFLKDDGDCALGDCKPERLKEEYHFIKRKRVYPNDPCPCGSGLKYKKCCGKKR